MYLFLEFERVKLHKLGGVQDLKKGMNADDRKEMIVVASSFKR